MWASSFCDFRQLQNEQTQNEHTIKQTVSEPRRQWTDGREQASDTHIHFVNIFVFPTSNTDDFCSVKEEWDNDLRRVVRAHVQD